MDQIVFCDRDPRGRKGIPLHERRAHPCAKRVDAVYTSELTQIKTFSPVLLFPVFCGKVFAPPPPPRPPALFWGTLILR